MILAMSKETPEERALRYSQVEEELAEVLPEGKALLVYELPPQWRIFVLSYMTHLNASRAAREAGYTDDPNAGWRLRKNKRISAAIRELVNAQAEGPDAVDVTSIRETLQGIMQTAIDQGDMRAATKAVELLGKSIGAFIDRKEVEHTLSYAELVARADSDEQAGVAIETPETVAMEEHVPRLLPESQQCLGCGATGVQGWCDDCDIMDPNQPPPWSTGDDSRSE